MLAEAWVRSLARRTAPSCGRASGASRPLTATKSAAPSARGVPHVCSAARYEPVRAVSSFIERVRWRWVLSSRNLTSPSCEIAEGARRRRFSPAAAVFIIPSARPPTRRVPTRGGFAACERGAGRTPQRRALVVLRWPRLRLRLLQQLRRRLLLLHLRLLRLLRSLQRQPC